MVSVVVPAHNERNVIGRLLSRLSDPANGDLEVIVVCNACTDDTAEVAAGYPGVRVLSTAVAGKANALTLGNSAASTFPRVYVDADVEVDRADILRLCSALDDPGVLVAAPSRRLARSPSRPVRMFNAVWQELPEVREGVFGRGVIALSAAGFQRIAELPPLMADDLAVSAMFAPKERRIVSDSVVVVHPSGTWSDLVRRRVRAATGTHQVYAVEDIRPETDSRTTVHDLIGVVRRRPSLLVSMPVFLTTAVIARHRAARAIQAQDYTTWMRDESSRSNEDDPRP